MDSLHRIGVYLSDPELVAQIQKYYGVERIEPAVDNYSSSKQTPVHRKTVKSNDNNSSNHEENAASDTDTVSSESDAESVGYRVTNWFWYYLFTLGTALGDELFYATSFHFGSGMLTEQLGGEC